MRHVGKQGPGQGALAGPSGQHGEAAAELFGLFPHGPEAQTRRVVVAAAAPVVVQLYDQVVSVVSERQVAVQRFSVGDNVVQGLKGDPVGRDLALLPVSPAAGVGLRNPRVLMSGG